MLKETQDPDISLLIVSPIYSDWIELLAEAVRSAIMKINKQQIS